jgi:hypothetical protein
MIYFCLLSLLFPAQKSKRANITSVRVKSQKSANRRFFQTYYVFYYVKFYIFKYVKRFEN